MIANLIQIVFQIISLVVLVDVAIVTALSAYVWVHHMFMTGINFDVREVFSFTTMAISIPFEGVVINYVLTLRKGSISLKTPMLFALGAIFFVILGGITGVFQASIALDEVFRGTYWVVGHFHYVMVGTTIFALIAALYYWFPKITGRDYNEKLGRRAFYASFIGFNILYFPYFFLIEMPRRVGIYADLPQLWPFNLVATIGALIFGPSIVFILASLIRDARKGKASGSNPWGSDATEWTGNYDSSLKTDKDETVQPPAQKTSMETKTYVEEEKETTILPLTISAGASMFVIGLALFLPLLLVGLLVIGISLAKWFKDDINEKISEVKESVGERWPFESVPKVKLGVFVFLTSEIVIFGSMIASYIYVRFRSATWPVATQTHNLTIGTVNTIILLTSSLAIILALEAIRNGNIRGLKIGLVGTFALGSIFLILKLGFEWPELIARGFTINGGLPPSTYYALTGAHAIHVGVGLVGVAYLIFRAFGGGFNADKHTTVEYVGLYWHFVDIVWMFLFPLFYLI